MEKKPQNNPPKPWFGKLVQPKPTPSSTMKANLWGGEKYLTQVGGKKKTKQESFPALQR